MSNTKKLTGIAAAIALGAGLSVIGLAAPANAEPCYTVCYYDTWSTKALCAYDQSQLQHQGWYIVQACTYGLANAYSWGVEYRRR